MYFFHAQAGYFYFSWEIRLKIFFCAFLDYRVHVHIFQLNKPDVTIQELNYQVELRQIFHPGGGLPYGVDGYARRLALGCKIRILVSLRVLWAKCHYF